VVGSISTTKRGRRALIDSVSTAIFADSDEASSKAYETSLTEGDPLHPYGVGLFLGFVDRLTDGTACDLSAIPAEVQIVVVYR
jgi:hypothetical protein